MVDLDDDGFAVISEHNIKTQNVKAHAALILLGLAVLILMSDSWQPADDRFYDDIFNSQFKGLNIDAIFSQFLVS